MLPSIIIKERDVPPFLTLFSCFIKIIKVVYNPILSLIIKKALLFQRASSYISFGNILFSTTPTRAARASPERDTVFQITTLSIAIPSTNIREAIRRFLE